MFYTDKTTYRIHVCFCPLPMWIAMADIFVVTPALQSGRFPAVNNAADVKITKSFRIRTCISLLV